MRRFLGKVALIICTSITAIISIYWIMFITPIRFSRLASEVFYSLNKADSNSGLPSVIIGGSVCNQIWPQKENSPNLAHLPCNQAITPAGTYLLLKRYLEHNPQTQEVFYAIMPGFLGNDMNLDYTYQYFVIPFMHGGDVELLATDTIQKLYDKFGQLFVESGYIKNVLHHNNFLMDTYIRYAGRRPEAKYKRRISPTAVIYLAKIRELCRGHKTALHVLPLPMSDTSENHDWENFRKDAKVYALDDLLGEFTQKIHYYPPEWFSDGTHFKPEILAQHLQEFRDSVMH